MALLNNKQHADDSAERSKDEDHGRLCRGRSRVCGFRTPVVSSRLISLTLPDALTAVTQRDHDLLEIGIVILVLHASVRDFFVVWSLSKKF
jgi:hypothetical protein